MMTLEQLFDECLNNPKSPLYTRDKDDFTVACNSVKAFLASVGRDIASTDILEVAVPGWVNDYFEFIFTQYKSNKLKDGKERTDAEKLKWATRYLKCLRKVLNLSIRQGLIPNIDYFDGIERLPDFARKQGVEEPDSVVDALSKVANDGLKIVSKRRPKTERPEDSPAPFEYDFQRVFGPFDRYLLCLYCGGMELDELSHLSLESADSGSRKIHLAWAGTNITVSKNVFDTLVEFSRSPLFDHCSPVAVTAGLERAKLRLFRAKSVFTDWLRYAARRGVGDETIKRLVALRFAKVKDCPPDLQQSIRSIVDDMAATCNRYRKQWYCIISHKGSAEDRFNELSEIFERDDAVIPYFNERRNDFYFVETSHLKTPRNRRNANPLTTVLKRYFFACLYSHETELLRQRLDNIRFLRSSKGSSAYARIPYPEMYKLQLVLESIKGSDVTLQLEDDEIREAIDMTPLAMREKVMIARPGYEGYEAEVIKIGAENRYSVRFPNINWNFVMKDVPRALIHRIS